MPELPEVETIKNDLRQMVIGRSVVGVRLLDPQLVAYPGPEEFVSRLQGQEIVGADRRAKYLIVRLSNGDSLVVQLIMTGQFLLLEPSRPLSKSARLILDLDDGQQLRLVDSGYLARVHLLSPAELGEKLPLNELGPEPLSEDFTLDGFSQRLGRRRGKLKPALLDQRFVAGLGNIYVDEVLFAARLHPARDIRTLTAEEVSRLYEAIRRILQEAIVLRGTTIATYRDVRGRKGGYQERLQVFGREGKPCPGCPGPVVRTFLGGRQTFFCPSCQQP